MTARVLTVTGFSENAVTARVLLKQLYHGMYTGCTSRGGIDSKMLDLASIVYELFSLGWHVSRNRGREYINIYPWQWG